MKKYIAVVGGVNVDIGGTPFSRMLIGDSNPGRITVTPGGVGRNIAENLCRLGQQVSIVTVIGDDDNGRLIRTNCEAIGLDLSHSVTLPGEHTSTYLCLNDEQGDLIGAVSDMAIYDRVTPALIGSRMDFLRESALIVLDANLPAETLAAIAEGTDVPIFADPVSVKKAGRLMPIISRCTMLKPNQAEASLLTGVDIEKDDDLPRAAEVLLNAGTRYAVISLGARGVYWNDGSASGIVPCVTQSIVNTSGCGDAFLAGAVTACLQGKALREMCVWGQAASAICAASYSAVNQDMSLQLLMQTIGNEQ